MDKDFFNKKFINAWGNTRDRSDHPIFRNAKQGDVAFVFNDPESKTGRSIRFLPASHLWYFYVKKDEEVLNLLKKGNTKHTVGENWIKIYKENKEYKDPKIANLVHQLE